MLLWLGKRGIGGHQRSRNQAFSSHLDSLLANTLLAGHYHKTQGAACFM